MTTTDLLVRTLGSLTVVAVVALAGCWTVPVANVQPLGEPRLIQESIAVRSVKEHAVVQSVDADQRTIVLEMRGQKGTAAYSVGPAVTGLKQIKPGDTVEATVAEELAVYILREGELPGPNGTFRRVASDAKVLLVDPSYRLLTLQYPDGRDETFKVGLDVRLGEMAPGDDVVIRPREVLDLRPEKKG
jgi:hypothetical protein